MWTFKKDEFWRSLLCFVTTQRSYIFFILKSIDKKMKSIQITFIIYFKLDPYSAGKGYVNEVLSLTLLESFALIIRLYR